MSVKALVLTSILAGVVCPSTLQAKEPPKEFSTWVTCLQSGAQKFAPSQESAQVAADAVIGLCKDEENSLLQRRLKTPTGERMLLGPRSLRSETYYQQHQSDVEEGRSRVTAWIMDLRAGR